MLCSAQALYPPVAGEPIRNWANINLLRESAQIGVFSVSGGPVPPPGSTESEYCGAGHPAKMLGGPQWMRRPDGLPSDGFYTDEAAAALRRLLADFAPDIVVLETFFMHRYYDVIREFDVRVILDA